MSFASIKGSPLGSIANVTIPAVTMNPTTQTSISDITLPRGSYVIHTNLVISPPSVLAVGSFTYRFLCDITMNSAIMTQRTAFDVVDSTSHYVTMSTSFLVSNDNTVVSIRCGSLNVFNSSGKMSASQISPLTYTVQGTALIHQII